MDEEGLVNFPLWNFPWGRRFLWDWTSQGKFCTGGTRYAIILIRNSFNFNFTCEDVKGISGANFHRDWTSVEDLSVGGGAAFFVEVDLDFSVLFKKLSKIKVIKTNKLFQLKVRRNTLLNTSLFTLILKFCPNSLITTLNHKNRLIRTIRIPFLKYQKTLLWTSLIYRKGHSILKLAHNPYTLYMLLKCAADWEITGSYRVSPRV